MQPAGSIQLLKVPLRSLKRSSRPGGRISGLRPAKACAALVDEIGATLAVVSDDELPHNSCTAGETGCVRSPAWNIERKIGSVGCGGFSADANDIAAGVTGRAAGKLER